MTIGYKLVANGVIAKLQILSDPVRSNNKDEFIATRALVSSLSNGYSASRDMFSNEIYKVGEILNNSNIIYYYDTVEALVNSVINGRWDKSPISEIDLYNLKKMQRGIRKVLYQYQKRNSGNQEL